MSFFTEIRQYCISMSHSYGHGVHSPFAFSVVRDIIRPRYEYYCEEELVNECISSNVSHQTEKDVLLLLRLMARFKLPTAIMSFSSGYLIKKAFLFGYSKVDIINQLKFDWKPKLIYARSGDYKVTDISASLKCTGSIVLCCNFTKDDITYIVDSLAGGCAFISRDRALIFSRERMEKVVYECTF